jgi:DNA-binding CsgD family transcriptional regulator
MNAFSELSRPRKKKPLSPREREVLAAVARWPSAPQRDVAWSLGLKLKTFKAHLYNARKKLA